MQRREDRAEGENKSSGTTTKCGTTTAMHIADICLVIRRTFLRRVSINAWLIIVLVLFLSGCEAPFLSAIAAAAAAAAAAGDWLLPEKEGLRRRRVDEKQEHKQRDRPGDPNSLSLLSSNVFWSALGEERRGAGIGKELKRLL